MKYKVGDKVRIVCEIYGHSFCVGDIVEILEVGGNGYEAVKNGKFFYVIDEELEPVGTETEENKGSKMLEVGKTYVDVSNGKHVCLFVNSGFAYMVNREGSIAYVWDKNTGKSLSLGSTYDIQTETVFKES
jgi:hypothetical protein